MLYLPHLRIVWSRKAFCLCYCQRVAIFFTNSLYYLQNVHWSFVDSTSLQYDTHLPLPGIKWRLSFPERQRAVAKRCPGCNRLRSLVNIDRSLRSANHIFSWERETWGHSWSYSLTRSFEYLEQLTSYIYAKLSQSLTLLVTKKSLNESKIFVYCSVVVPYLNSYLIDESFCNSIPSRNRSSRSKGWFQPSKLIIWKPDMRSESFTSMKPVHSRSQFTYYLTSTIDLDRKKAAGHCECVIAGSRGGVVVICVRYPSFPMNFLCVFQTTWQHYCRTNYLHQLTWNLSVIWRVFNCLCLDSPSNSQNLYIVTSSPAHGIIVLRTNVPSTHVAIDCDFVIVLCDIWNFVIRLIIRIVYLHGCTVGNSVLE